MCSTSNMAALLGIGARKIFTASLFRTSVHSSVRCMRIGVRLENSVLFNGVLPRSIGVRLFTDVSAPESELEFENDTAGRPVKDASRRPQRSRAQNDGRSYSRFAYERTMRKLGSVSSKETLKKHFEHMLEQGKL